MFKKKEEKASVKVKKEVKEPVKPVTKVDPVETPNETKPVCPICKGTGKNPLEIEDPCPKCGGK